MSPKQVATKAEGWVSHLLKIPGFITAAIAIGSVVGGAFAAFYTLKENDQRHDQHLVRIDSLLTDRREFRDRQAAEVRVEMAQARNKADVDHEVLVELRSDVKWIRSWMEINNTSRRASNP